jgi:hypothetical protein
MSSTLNTLFDKGTGIYLNILNKMAEDEPDQDKKQQINELIAKLNAESSEMNDTLKSFITELKSIYPECDYNSSPSNTKIENILKVDAGTAIGSALMAIMLLGGKKKKTRGKKYRVSKKKSRRSTKK